MGIAEAKKYIEELHKKQENPYLWPDYLTGLPERSAIIKKLDEVFPKLGKFAISYVRIANVHPYIIKYGPDKHADIIQWAAAVLKTTCEKCKGCFVGTVNTHDFVLMCETKNMTRHIKEATRVFNKKVESFYSKNDLKKRTTLSFRKNGTTVNIGLMRLASVIVNAKPEMEKNLLIQQMGKACEEMERTEDSIVLLSDGYLSRID